MQHVKSVCPFINTALEQTHIAMVKQILRRYEV